MLGLLAGSSSVGFCVFFGGEGLPKVSIYTTLTIQLALPKREPPWRLRGLRFQNLGFGFTSGLRAC